MAVGVPGGKGHGQDEVVVEVLPPGAETSLAAAVIFT